ncbi:hypothetical protein EDC01DRAFT_618477 [Geopyxis carbonaria]|nr:hypothetical protein EDC01DRAFT_618477 [Geopyxis carbonaria]
MSVSPLTSTRIAETPVIPKKHQNQRSSSYIQVNSELPTPNILSPVKSTSQASRTFNSDLHKAKSTSQLNGGNERSLSTEWLYRTGAALQSDARKSKGQGWLSARESSTSLVHLEQLVGESNIINDDQTLIQPPIWGNIEHSEMGRITVGKDHFVHPENENVESQQRFGIDQLIDRLLGWTFLEQEDSDDDEDEKIAYRSLDKNRRHAKDAKFDQQPQRRDEEGWQDPAWILTVASSLML